MNFSIGAPTSLVQSECFVGGWTGSKSDTPPAAGNRRWYERSPVTPLREQCA